MTEVLQEDGEEADRLPRRRRRRRILVASGALVLFAGTIIGAVSPGTVGHPGQPQAKAACTQLQNVSDGIAPVDLAFTDANAAANTATHYTAFFTAVQHLQAAESSGDVTRFSDTDRAALVSVCGHQLPDVVSIVRGHGESVASTDYLQLALQIDSPEEAALRNVVTDSTALAAAQKNASSGSQIAADESTFETDLAALAQVLQTASATLASQELLLTYWRADEETAALAVGRLQNDCVGAAGAGSNISVLNTDLAQLARDLTAERAAVQSLRHDMGVAPLSVGFL
jgi:hypothetical protein